MFYTIQAFNKDTYKRLGQKLWCIEGINSHVIVRSVLKDQSKGFKLSIKYHVSST